MFQEGRDVAHRRGAVQDHVALDKVGENAHKAHGDVAVPGREARLHDPTHTCKSHDREETRGYSRVLFLVQLPQLDYAQDLCRTPVHLSAVGLHHGVH